MTLLKSAVHLLWQHHQCQCPIKMMTLLPAPPINLKITRKFHFYFNKSTYQRSGGDTSPPDGIPQGPENRKVKAWNEAASVMIVAPMNNSLPYSLGYLVSHLKLINILIFNTKLIIFNFNL